MLPSVVASELEQVAADAIRTAFHPTTPGFAGLIERFLADRERLLKGPYISISMPFRKGQRADWFPELRLPFTPWRHQEQAFTRLSPGSPQNTLVATGTGSGKTECFLYPALDHCRLAQQNGQRGVKVILIYPMNALATDQAKRIAQIIHTTPALAGVRAGLYIGDQEEQSALAMGPEQVITDRASLHQAPPDILLTNYKQLDYLLLQPHAQGLWAHNGTSAEGTSVLRYLVVDEFHTFDGAQGTDLACLIRRLRHRLHAQGEQLICVGTSATLGDGDSQAEMLHYAGQIFGCGFSRDALIQESRLRPAEFFEETAFSDPKQGLLLIPPPALEQQPLLDPASYGGASGRTAATAVPDGVRLAYLAAQVPLWFGAEFPLPASGDLLDPDWRIELGRQLGRLPAAQNLVRQAHQLCSLQELLERFAKQLGIDGRYPLRFRILLLESLLALIAHARAPDGRPWVQLRVQLWLRELKRMVASVDPTPELLHSDDLTGQEDEKHLPVVHCRDCGATGWTSTLLHQNASQLDPARNLRNFYRAFFARDPLVRYVFPLRSLADSPAESEPLASAERLFCRDCLTIQDPPRSSCASSATPVLAPSCQSCSSTNLVVAQVPEITVKDSNGHLRSSSDCPSCGAHRSLLLIGATAASLTSSCAASLFASSFNSDRKLLTFSDSVQDAAHRAGFIAARAYRTTFRTALTATLQATGHDLSLPALQDALIAHWQRQLDPLDFVATFLPSDLEWLKEWAEIEQSRQPVLPPDSPLPGIVEKRLRWEVIAEFGYRSRLGSSLEQAGSLAAGLDPARLESVLAALLPRLINEVEGLRQLEADRLRRFLVGWLQHLRQRGAIPVPELLGATGGSPSRYLSSGGIDTFPFKLIQHLPNLGPSSNKPVFLTSARGRGHFEPIASLKGRPTWAMRWLLRSLGLPPLPEALAAKPQVSDPATAHGTLTPDPSPASSLAAESIAIALQLAVEELERGGLLQALPQGQGGERLWGIPPDAVLVDGDLTPMRCERCGDSQAIRSRDRALWEEMPCLVSGCLGQYVAEPQAGSLPGGSPNWGLPLYRRLYNSGQVRRIIAREHTGLLSRRDRERLEHQFIHDGPRSHPNLLSATSTLEMGINIGDLSSVLLCSVPPEPANYLQRIGRAGRRDGNALITTIVTGNPHDLSFYGEPTAMLQGRVSPPGCYLDAAAILARQLVAYSLDRWVTSGIAIEALPRQIKAAIDAFDLKDAEVKQRRFPYTWLTWVRDHQNALLDDFLVLFDGDTVQERCREQLRQRFLAPADGPSDLEQRLIERLSGLAAERRRLRSEGKRLIKRRDDLATIPAASILEAQKQELDGIQRELQAYASLRQQLEERPLLQVLTDEGFLPNYAFPEAGVTLQSVLWRRLTQKPRAGRTSEDLEPLRYERPSSVAIRELVPDGVFYAQGRRVQIDQIDLALNPIERWRFCRGCSFSVQEGEEGFHNAICPRCGDANFCDAHQVKEMARLRQVIATSDDALSRISDDRDDRSPTFFQRQLLVIPDLNRVEITLAVPDGDFPFGAEFLAATTFREINFGALNPIGSGHQIAGQQFRVRGFELCGSCGKVLKGKPHSNQHAYSCNYRNDPENAKARQLLFLYREFSSEALRFLLPDRLFWDDSGQNSFQAALNLGLKRHFSGRVDHLQAAIASEPQPGSTPSSSGGNQRKTFLYLYDAVPGGTGYLRQLVENGGERLRQVLEDARSALQACSCHDGCYRCLYAYRSRFQRDRTSKERALAQLQLLQDRWSQLQSSSRSLTSVAITNQTESELEERFLNALREGKAAPAGQAVRFNADTWKGQPAFRLKVGQTSWILQTQIELGAEHGVTVPSRCDALITPTAGGLPIAIYTDGWDYHRGRLATDVAQRMALQRSGNVRFWALSWEDVVGKPNGPAHPLPANGLQLGLTPSFRRDPAAFAEQWLSLSRLQEAGGRNAGLEELLPPDLRWIQESNSLQWLMAYLSLPSEALRCQVWEGLAHTFCLAQMGQDLSQSLPADFSPQLETLGLASHLEDWRAEREKGQAGHWLEQAPGFSTLSCIDLVGHLARRRNASFRALHVAYDPSGSEAEQIKGWREWLRQANLFQFLPHMLLTTPGCTGFEVQSAREMEPEPPATLPSETWRDALRFASSYASKCLPLLTELQPHLQSLAVEPPEFGYEPEGARGETMAELEMAWPDQKVALTLAGNDPDPEAPPDPPLPGWQLFSIDTPAATILAAFQP